MSISFFNEDVDLPKLNFPAVKKGIKKQISLKEVYIGVINFIFCSDDYLLNINLKYLDHDFFTDVITFDYCNNDIISGDIFISCDRVRSNAEKYNEKLDIEMLRVIAHGILHLLKYDDKELEEIKLMRSLELDFIERIVSFY